MIGVPPVQGVDQQLRINHFGPFLLTRLLTPDLAPDARIVNVVSRAHKQGSLRISEGMIQGTPSHWCVTICNKISQMHEHKFTPNMCKFVVLDHFNDAKSELHIIIFCEWTVGENTTD